MLDLYGRGLIGNKDSGTRELSWEPAKRAESHMRQRRLKTACASTHSDQSSLAGLWIANDSKLRMTVKKTDQTARMCRLVRVCAVHTSFCWFCCALARLILEAVSRLKLHAAGSLLKLSRRLSHFRLVYE